MKSENGNPLSRANAHTWRDDAAKQVIVPTRDNKIRTTVNTVVPAMEPVELYRTWMIGTPVGEFSTSSTLPRQKHNVMSMIKPKRPSNKVAHTMADGGTREASLSSSAMCAPASGPRKHQSGVVIPTKQESPMLPHPPPSENCVNTWLAGARSLVAHNVIRKAKNPTTCRARNIPSTNGSFPARKILKATATTIKIMMKRAVCHIATTLAFSFFNRTNP